MLCEPVGHQPDRLHHQHGRHERHRRRTAPERCGSAAVRGHAVDDPVESGATGCAGVHHASAARSFRQITPSRKAAHPATIKPGKRIRLKVKVTTKGPKTGRIGVRAVSTKAVLRYKSVNLPKDGTRKISLPKKWSRVGRKGKVKVTVQFLGNISVKPSNKDKVKSSTSASPAQVDRRWGATVLATKHVPDLQRGMSTTVGLPGVRAQGS